MEHDLIFQLQSGKFTIEELRNMVQILDDKLFDLAVADDICHECGRAS